MKKAVIISCFDWYEKRIKPIEDVLKKKEYDVNIIVSDFSHIEKKYVEKRFNSCTYIHVPKYRKNISLLRIKSHLYFGKQVNKLINEIKPDLIYLLLPPNNIAKYCLNYKKRNPSVKYYVDVIDLWPESLPIPFINKVHLLDFMKKYRNKSLLEANHVFLECNLYKKCLKKYISENKVTTNYLYKIQTNEEKVYIKNNFKISKNVNSKITFAYLGSINYIIDIDGIIRLLTQVKDMNYDVELFIIGDGNNKEYFLNELKKNKINFQYYGIVFDEKEKFDILNNCDFGINMMKNVSVGLTIKSIDYFSYGLPIINNIKGDTWQLVEQEKIGINYKGNITKNDIEEILKINKNDVISVYNKNFTIENFKEKIDKILK